MSRPNQNLSQMQGRYWLLTMPFERFQVPEELPEPVCWMRGQQEIGGTTNYHHWHVIIATKTKVRGSAIARIFGTGIKIELTRSERAENYVFKDETAIEGTRFEKGQKLMKRNSKTDWKKIKDLAVAGELTKISEENPQVFISSYRTLKQISIDYMVAPQDMSSTTGVWIYGPPGVGKSHFARDTYGRDLYMKAQNKWWDGYQNQRFVLLDDLDTNVLGHYLKIWADKYSFMAESKGSSRLIRPEKFIVTSNYRIEDLFVDPILCEAIKRRFYIIEIPMRRY